MYKSVFSFIILLSLKMSITLTLTGNTSILVANYFPPIDLDRNYECGLVDFHSYNSVPNVDKENNLLHINDKFIELPVGSYEFQDISTYLQKKYEEINKDGELFVEANYNTLKTEIYCTDEIDFSKNRTIGSLLGFSKRKLKAKVEHESDLPINITQTNAVRIECNIVGGSYINNSPAHTLHEFSLNGSPGYKLDEIPRNVIYLPVNTRHISSITVKVVNQNGDLLNFRGETITLRLHLRPKE